MRELIAAPLDERAIEVAMVDADGVVLVMEPEFARCDAELLAEAVRLGGPVMSRAGVAMPIRRRDVDGRLVVIGALGLCGAALEGWPLGPVLIRALDEVLERELAEAKPLPDRPSTPLLRVLGTAAGRLELPGIGTPRNVAIRLSLRHSEILLLLAHHRAGLSARELGEFLYTEPISEVTIRAEIARLRRVVGPILAGSRPYRLGPPMETDVNRLLALLAAGDAPGALDAYRGPVLVSSTAPWVERLRDDVSRELRRVVVHSGDAEALARLRRLDPARR